MSATRGAGLLFGALERQRSCVARWSRSRRRRRWLVVRVVYLLVLLRIFDSGSGEGRRLVLFDIKMLGVDIFDLIYKSLGQF